MVDPEAPLIELEIYEDCVSAIEYIISRRGIDNGKIFVFAQSLGGANAITAIANNEVFGIRANCP